VVLSSGLSNAPTQPFAKRLNFLVPYPNIQNMTNIVKY
jgi:hypothetical protein